MNTSMCFWKSISLITVLVTSGLLFFFYFHMTCYYFYLTYQCVTLNELIFVVISGMAYPVPICGVCERRQKFSQADIWCLDCDEGLSRFRSDHHCAARLSQNHNAIPVTQYALLPGYVKNINQLCEKHGEKYQLYCHEHSNPCCRSCI